MVESVCQLIKNSRLQSFLGQEAAILNLSKCSKQFSPIFYSIFSNFPILFSPIFLFNFSDFFSQFSPIFLLFQVVNNSGLIVQRGDSSFLSKYNLSITTNLNAFGSDIKFRILKPPGQGIILKDDVPVLTFTAQDILEEILEYRHNNSHKPKDEMKLEITATDSNRNVETSTKTNFVFHVYPESYWEPLAIASNNSILVEESTSIAITRYDLQVESRAEMAPKDIIYMVRNFKIGKSPN